MPLHTFGTRVPKPPGLYVETQTNLHCGMHAINNAIGLPYISQTELARYAHIVVQEIGTDTARDHMVPGKGYYSHSILAYALNDKRERGENSFVLTPREIHTSPDCLYQAFHADAQGYLVQGALVNMRIENHWFAVVMFNGTIYALDSIDGSTFKLTPEDFSNLISTYPTFPIIDMARPARNLSPDHTKPGRWYPTITPSPTLPLPTTTIPQPPRKLQITTQAPATTYPWPYPSPSQSPPLILGSFNSESRHQS